MIGKQCLFKFENPNQEGHMLDCKQCPTCKSKRRFTWVMRMQLEELESINSWMITLTYDEKHVPEYVDIKPANWKSRGYYHRTPYKWKPILQRYKGLNWLHVQNYIRSLKQAIDHVDERHKLPFGYNLRYFAVGELGSQTQRPHYHIYVWNLPKYIAERAHRYWPHGTMVDVGKTRTDKAAASYAAKYIMKHDKQDKTKFYKTSSNSIGKARVVRYPNMIKQGLLHHGKFKIALPNQWYKIKYKTEEEWERVKEELEFTMHEEEEADFNEILERLEGDYYKSYETIDLIRLNHMESIERKLNKSITKEYF